METPSAKRPKWEAEAVEDDGGATFTKNDGDGGGKGGFFSMKNLPVLGMIALGSIVVYLTVSYMETQKKLKKCSKSMRHCTAANQDIPHIAQMYMTEHFEDTKDYLFNMGYVVVSQAYYESLMASREQLESLLQQKTQTSVSKAAQQEKAMQGSYKKWTEAEGEAEGEAEEEDAKEGDKEEDEEDESTEKKGCDGHSCEFPHVVSEEAPQPHPQQVASDEGIMTDLGIADEDEYGASSPGEEEYAAADDGGAGVGPVGQEDKESGGDDDIVGDDAFAYLLHVAVAASKSKNETETQKPADADTDADADADADADFFPPPSAKFYNVYAHADPDDDDEDNSDDKDENDKDEDDGVEDDGVADDGVADDGVEDDSGVGAKADPETELETLQSQSSGKIVIDTLDTSHSA